MLIKSCYALKTVMRGPQACVSNKKVKTLKLLHIPLIIATCFYMKTSTDTISNCKSVMMHIIVASLNLVLLTTQFVHCIMHSTDHLYTS